MRSHGIRVDGFMGDLDVPAILIACCVCELEVGTRDVDDPFLKLA